MPKIGRSWLAALGTIVAIACTVFFALQVTGLVSQGNVELSGSAHLFPGSLVSFLFAYLAFASGWHQLLAAAGVRSRLWSDIGIFTTTQFAKYLPGNVGHHVGRVALAAKLGLPPYAVVATMFVEILIVVALMAALSLPLLGFWVRRLALDLSSLAYAGAGSASLAMLACLALYANRHHPRLARPLAAVAGFRNQGMRSYLRLGCAVALILAGIMLSAFSLGMLDGSGQLVTATRFPVVLGLFAAAWLLGFVTPGAPAGIGIREVILTEGLAPLVGRDHSIAIALLFRILSTGADLLVFLIGIGMLWLDRKRMSS